MNSLWCVGNGNPFTNDKVCATFETSCKLGDEFRWVSEVALQQQDCISAWVPGLRNNVPKQLVDGACIPVALFGLDNCERQHFFVLQQHVYCAVIAGVVEHHDVIIAWKARENRSDAPHKDANRFNLVVCGNCDKQHWQVWMR